MKLVLFLAAGFGVAALADFAGGGGEEKDGALDAPLIEKLTGLKGALNAEEGAFKVSSPRDDVKVAVDGWRMRPFLGLTSWATFQTGKRAQAMVMGDLVLFEDEVNPVLSALLKSGLAVTALHNHFFFARPQVYFMHLSGEGGLALLAKGVRAALDTVKEVRSARAAPAEGFGGQELPEVSSISPGPIEMLLGTKAQTNSGMVKVVIGRKVRAPCGCEVGKEMGVNTWAAFAGSDDNAVVDGDFAVLEDELQPVLKALRQAGINVVAIHNHMTHENPRMLFLHYWGKGRATDLAKAIQRGLREQKP